MKKIFIVIIGMIILTGCKSKLGNTPVNKVEDYINKYQTLDVSVLKSLENVLSTEEYNSEQKEKYKDIVKKNYQKIMYEIRNDSTDGDIAIVEVEITVVDYSKINNEVDLYLLNNSEEFKTLEGEFDISKVIDYRLEKMDKAKETVTYTLEIELHKENDEWIVDDLDEVELSKINGTYNY